jgi:hypothetical protein
MSIRIKFPFLLLLFLLLALPSCTQDPILTVTKISANPTTEPTHSPTPEPKPFWREFRESIDGWGIAVPFNWFVEPMSEESIGFRRIRIRNFTASFFQAHSEKGAWTEDVIDQIVSMEIVKFYGIPNTLSLEETIRQVYRLDVGSEQLLSSEVVLINGNQALFFTLSTTPGIDPYDGYMFRISYDAVLVFYTNPNSSWEKPESTAILNSIVLDREKEIIFPEIEPSPMFS